MDYNFITEAYSPEARPFALLASLRATFLNTHILNVEQRFNREIMNILNPPPLDHLVRGLESLQSTRIPDTSDSPDIPPSSPYRHGSTDPQKFMDDRLERAMSIGKIEILTSTVAPSTCSRYQSGWNSWQEFCDGMKISPHLDPSIKGWGEIVLDFLTWEHRIMGVGYSALVTRCCAILFARLIEGCDLSNASFRIRSFLKAAKRLNPVMKKIPGTVELSTWISSHFIDSQSLPDNQLWAALMVGFFFCMRVSEIENLRENDLVFQNTDDGMALAIRIRKSKTDQEYHGALRPLLPTGAVMCPSAAVINWLRMRGGVTNPTIFFSKVCGRVLRGC